MEVLSNPAGWKQAHQGVCVAIGMFDGVHLGHQAVIRHCLGEARRQSALGLAVTFDRHPSAVVSPGRAPHLIQTLGQKLGSLRGAGMDATWVVQFDQAFSALSGERFLRLLGRHFRPLRAICVGEAFLFGHKRSGSFALIKALASELGYTAHGIPACSLDGEVVSSTRIRNAIRHGRFELAARLLGRPYSLAGRVMMGDRIGRQLGFPTANIDVAGLAIPPHGVYAAQALVGEAQYAAVLNIGHRPTISQATAQLRVEAHLLDFDGDLYGREIEVILRSKLRDEMRLPSREALRERIRQDVLTVRGRLLS